jgi:hypothetical protein
MNPVRALFINKLLTLSFTPYQTFIFLKILFKIRNQHKILRKKVDKKFYFLYKIHSKSFLKFDSAHIKQC